MNDDRATTAARVRCAEFILAPQQRACAAPNSSSIVLTGSRRIWRIQIATRTSYRWRNGSRRMYGGIKSWPPRGRSCNYRPRPTGLLRGVLCPSRRARLLRYDGNALQTLVAIMNDDRATTAARVRCAEFILAPQQRACAAPNSSSIVLTGSRRIWRTQIATRTSYRWRNGSRRMYGGIKSWPPRGRVG